MLNYLDEIDKVLFILINEMFANRVTDIIMPFITSDDFLRIVYALILLGMLIFGNKKTRWLVLFSGLTMLATDQIVAGWLKHWIARPRPCQVFSDIHLLVACGAGFAMPSAHAANTFGQAVILSKHIRYVGWPMYLFAIAVSLSRVFVGVHYPGDITVGALLGIMVGLVVSGLFTLFSAKLLKPEPLAAESEDAEPDEPTQE